MRIQNAFRAGLIGTLGVGVGILLITAIGSLATILTYIGAALFLALGLDPAVKWLVARRFPHWAAILTVIVAVLAVCAGLIMSVLPNIIDQTAAFVATLPAIIQSLTTQDWVGYLNTQFGGFVDVHAILGSLADFFKNPSNISSIAGGAFAVGISIANGVTGTIVVVILTLYFTSSMDSIKSVVYSLVPKSKRETFIRMSEEITSGVGKYVVGQIALALLNGILTFILLTIIGGKAALVFAFIAFLLALIPLIGTVLASTIIILGQLILASPETALVALIYYLVYMQIEAYVISPRIMNKAVAVPGSIVVIAALAGGTLLGILGALVAIPIAASVILIVKEIVIPAQEEH
ncbi:AI-2E family transporter [Alpinimonas psychrophila]|uniref:Putative PurR-regulated permease PerM n=1 Tax=Alpinimonas psychrophila TaxID=748908 RepID=A0A7W3PP55_9MICO|nr:putative PurR-regulated permease PerM [Alpinimonas psychrophila]